MFSGPLTTGMEEVTRYNFHCILLIRASHKASSRSKSIEMAPPIQRLKSTTSGFELRSIGYKPWLFHLCRASCNLSSLDLITLCLKCRLFDCISVLPRPRVQLNRCTEGFLPTPSSKVAPMLVFLLRSTNNIEIS